MSQVVDQGENSFHIVFSHFGYCTCYLDSCSLIQPFVPGQYLLTFAFILIYQAKATVGRRYWISIVIIDSGGVG